MLEGDGRGGGYSSASNRNKFHGSKIVKYGNCFSYFLVT